MKGEQAYPARGVDGVCVRMMTRFSDPGGNVMDRDDPVENHCDHKAEKTKGKVIEERVAYHLCSTFTRADYSSVADIHQLFDGPQWVQDLAPREQLSGPQEHRRAPRQ